MLELEMIALSHQRTSWSSLLFFAQRQIPIDDSAASQLETVEHDFNEYKQHQALKESHIM